MSRMAASVSWRERPHQVEHLGLDGGVEAGRRLVEHEQLGVTGQRHGDHDPLLHAARQLVRVALHHPVRVGDAHPAQRLARLRQGVPAVVAEDRERLDDLATDLHRRVQRRPGVLVHHRRLAGAEPSQLLVRHARHVVAADEDPAPGDHRVRRQVAQGGVGGRRLATTGLADQAVGLARLDVERHPAQHLARNAADLVGELQVLDGERRRAGLGGRDLLDDRHLLPLMRTSPRRSSRRPGWWR